MEGLCGFGKGNGEMLTDCKDVVRFDGDELGLIETSVH